MALRVQILVFALLGLICSSVMGQVTIPQSFDSRSRFGSCMREIITQGDCGSCYAWSSAGSLGERACIFGHTELSRSGGRMITPQTILSCSGTPYGGQNLGCDGGYSYYSWLYLQTVGAPTCTALCTQGCMPYTSAKCKEGSDKYDNGCRPCPAPLCYNGDKYAVYKAKSFGNIMAHSGLTQEQSIMLEIMTNGPVQTCFMFYSNFMDFFKKNPNGIYSSLSGQNIGGHCVEIIGWGVERNTKYWIMANTWGPNWASQGYFKYLRGVDLGGAERWAYAGCPANTNCRLTFPVVGKRSAEDDGPRVGSWTPINATLVADDFPEEVEFATSALQQHIHSHQQQEPAGIRVVDAYAQPVAGLNLKLKMAATVAGEPKLYMVDVQTSPIGQHSLQKITELR